MEKLRLKLLNLKYKMIKIFGENNIYNNLKVI